VSSVLACHLFRCPIREVVPVARRSPQTAGKREREQAKRERRERKQARRAARTATATEETTDKAIPTSDTEPAN
jgi:hypothetical protein